MSCKPTDSHNLISQNKKSQEERHAKKTEKEKKEDV